MKASLSRAEVRGAEGEMGWAARMLWAHLIMFCLVSLVERVDTAVGFWKVLQPREERA